MKQLLALILALALSYTYANWAPNAVGSLYKEADNASLQFVCTANVVEGAPLGYDEAVVVTASHCLDRDLRFDERTETYSLRGHYLIRLRDLDFYAVTARYVGYQEQAYDVAILEFVTDRPSGIQPLRLGRWESVEVGAQLHNYANPEGLGLQYFQGYISQRYLDRDIGPGQANWRGYALAQLAASGGSSGSLVLNQVREVIGILIGGIVPRGSRYTVVVPVERLVRLVEDERAGAYIEP